MNNANSDAAALSRALAKILPRVAKPGRYTGGEWNITQGDWEAAELSMAFLFPDVYEVGMSNLALRLIYDLVNADPRFLCERCFTPWPDMADLMRERGIPLYALESKRPLAEFDVLGFTLQYELSYTNILHMLDLAGLPRYRDDSRPWLLAGGPCALQPEPLAPFFDAFLLGDGEELLPLVLETILTGKKNHAPRAVTKEQLARLPGVYLPEYYEPHYSGGVFSGISTLPPAPPTVSRAVVPDLNTAHFPAKWLLPYTEPVHDRVMLEVMRGCTRGCRFCQAGMIYRPLRERRPEVLQELARRALASSGYEEIALVSLSTSDYSCLNTLLPALAAEAESLGVSLSLPSLRVDAFDPELAASVQKVRKSGLTFAPEAGTQRLRDVINKNVSAQDLFRTCATAYTAGWNHIKLYYMIGLPTETEADLDGIAAEALQVLASGKKGRSRLAVSAANFVPKAHTPFQWSAQDSREELNRKQQYLCSKLRGKERAGLKFQYHDTEQSMMEAVLARGDRRLAVVLSALVDKGARFDGWSEHFQAELWQETLREAGLPAENQTGARAPGAPLPWDHISPGVNREFLSREAAKALTAAVTPDCRSECSDCGACEIKPVGATVLGCPTK
jgi:radical SAM family uncharacterized protein